MGVNSAEKNSKSPVSASTVVQYLHRGWCRGIGLIFSPELKVILITSLTTSGLVLGIQQVGGLQPAELSLFDRMTQLKPDQNPDPRLLVVGINEADIRTQNHWPLSDHVIAKTLASLQQHKPQVIGLDIFRDIAIAPGHASLQAQLKKTNVIAINYLGNTEDERIPAPPYLAKNQVGFCDLVSDPDGVIRRNLMFVSDGTATYTSFALKLALYYLREHQVPAQLTEAGEFQLGETVFARLRATAGAYQTADTAGYQILLNYRSVSNAVRVVPLQQVLQGKVDPNWVKGKVVLIGVTAPSAKDLHYTPYSSGKQGNLQMPGVVIHAQMVSQVLSAVLDGQPLFWFWSDWVEIAWIVGWAVVGSILGWQMRHWLVLGLGGGVALGILVGIGFGVFTHMGWVPVIAPALAMVLAGGSAVAYRVFHYTFHDALTGLPNRALFLKHLNRLIRQQKRSVGFGNGQANFAVLFLDLDRFKVVNDNLGHEIGDQLLIRTGQRLKNCLSSSNTLARVGGDEFAILLKGVSDLEQATAIASQLQQEMALPFWIQDQEIFTSVSVGIALSQADPNHQPEDLLRDAHTAMYQAKALGKARQEVFATGMRVQVVRRLQLETDLRRAIEQQEFQLHYQPIVALETGKTAGFEALVRWQHPQNGFISPAEFIPVAEETGLIVPLGQWVIRTACQQIKQWQTEFKLDSALMVSVNLSGQQFTQPDLVEFIEETLAAIELEGHSLKLEITESVAMNNVESAIAMLVRLKALNLQLSIDDFGTGYSSLSYLYRFPVDTLKIDRSFVSRMDDAGDDAAIVQTIVGLAHSLNMNVVAEGVETAAQLARLQTMQCEYGQGYFFSKPLPAQGAKALLAAKTCWLER
ncbi:EAL domain-containing protein [Leptothermofonsia sp. ETS-13]|uniref:EAL domain-containing protein n=1 Tax=Leptothermofonsia sp. ETS-13 TaxID=3035696 RepID=UPI003BA0D8AF